jgi:hypothetical protein
MRYVQVSATVQCAFTYTDDRARNRHVKCDEEKPSCRRCLNVGRTCEGYNTTTKTAKPWSVVTVYLPPPQKQRSALLVSQETEFYLRNIAPKLSGYFHSDFWQVLIMQFSQSEPAIHHAVSAISAIHRGIDHTSSNADLSQNTWNQSALQHYNTAIKCVSTRMQQDPNSKLIPLVVCLLFTCIEFLQGDAESAMIHMRSGFTMLENSRQSGSSVSSDISDLQHTTDLSAIERYLVPVFSALDILCVLFGQVYSDESPSTGKDDIAFTTVLGARWRLVGLMDAAVRFIYVAEARVYDRAVTMDDYITQMKLENELCEWRRRLDDLVSNLIKSNEPPVENAINLLRIHHRVVSIWLSVCLSIDAAAMDAHTASFEEIVDLGSKLTIESTEQQPEKFSFELQIIPPLYYTAIKCQVPSIRRRAVELLRLAPRREGLWNAHVATKVAEMVIEIEERNIDCEKGTALEMARRRWKNLPSGLSRIDVIDLPRSHKIAEDVSNPVPARVGFRFKPCAVSGECYDFTEEIVL